MSAAKTLGAREAWRSHFSGLAFQKGLRDPPKRVGDESGWLRTIEWNSSRSQGSGLQKLGRLGRM